VRVEFASQPEVLRNLLAATASCSPYLFDAMQKEFEWLDQALTLSPEAVEAEIANSLTQNMAVQLVIADLSFYLRRAKRRLALMVALADVGGIWDVMRTTKALSDFADLAVQLALKSLLRGELLAGHLPHQGLDDLDDAAGFVVLGMGKLGAYELNYSSDIDLICLFDESRYGDDAPAARAVFLRVTRALTATLSQITDQGYVFRTDLRLRPDASVTPVCISMAAAEAYYESVGRTWERAAYIKARVIAGDFTAGARFLRILKPFVWRKYLDFTAIQDAHDMRLRIRDFWGTAGPIQAAGHNVKLGKGGIREIEFFTQTRQLIAGGRDPDLRDSTTLGGLEALNAKGWITKDLSQALSNAYIYFRVLEHRLQMVHDTQTHDIPTEPLARARLAHFCGWQDLASFEADLAARFEHIHRLTEDFFSPQVTAEHHPLKLSTKTRDLVEGWHLLPALRSQRAQIIFQRLLPSLLQSLQRAAHPNNAFAAFDQFLADLPAGAQIFSMFELNPQLVDLIVDIMAIAPDLARYLSRNSEVFDAVIGGYFFTPWPEISGLSADLEQRLAVLLDYESALEEARRWQKEFHFRIGVHHLRGLIDAFEAGRHYSDLARVVIKGLWTLVTREFSRKYGPCPGRGAALLGMGSLGAGLLNALSDLDVIVIYDPLDETMSEGPKPLASRAYYARLTQAFVTAISAQMSAGRLYEVDMRLRPSGRQGPVATSFSAFKLYQEQDAWAWEHLALTRASPIAGHAGLIVDIENLRNDLIRKAGARVALAPDVQDMRDKLASAHPNISPYEAKFGTGRLMDIELFVQFLALKFAVTATDVMGQIDAALLAHELSQIEATNLKKSYNLFWKLRVSTQLLNVTEVDLSTMGEGPATFLLRELGQRGAKVVQNQLEHHAEKAKFIIAQHLKHRDINR
jgi:glutamate-ammonia-ligase adenylyltransferase